MSKTLARLRIRNITPMFVGGADPRDPDPVAEGLRAASLRGCLRYWLRWLIGSDNPVLLRDEEAKIFGGLNAASKLRPSPLRVRVENVGRPSIYEWRRAAPSERGRTDKDFYYLGDVAFRRTKESNARRGLAPGAQLDLAFELRPFFELGAEGRMALERKLSATLWLFFTFGAVGARSRRGFGALEIIDILELNLIDEQAGDYLKAASFNNPNELVSVWQSMQPGLSRFVAGVLSLGFPNIGNTAVYVSERTCPSWEALLNDVAREYKSARKTIPLRHRLAFGAPIQRASKEQPNKERADKADTICFPDVRRWASPLRIRPIRYRSDNYGLVLCDSLHDISRFEEIEQRAEDVINSKRKVMQRLRQAFDLIGTPPLQTSSTKTS